MGTVCVIKWVSRGTSHIAVMIPDYKGFIVKTMHYIDEIRANEAEIVQADVSDETVDKAIALITSKMMRPFAIEDFKESYNASLRELIERKAAGETIVVEQLKPATPTDSVDDALDQMLA
jgi:DNA end-binding protein Ku